MKKILIMHPEMCVGGAEKVLLTILQHIDKKKFEVTLLLLNKCDKWDNLIPKDINVRYLFKKNPREFGPIMNRLYKYGRMIIPGILIKKFIIKDNYDTCIAFHEPMIYFLKGAHGKKIAWIHADYGTVKTLPEINQLRNKNGFLATFIWKQRLKIYDICDNIVCVADSARKGFIEKFNYNYDKVIYKYNPNDVNKILLKSKEDTIYQLTSDINFCSVGRLSYEKALYRIIDAVYRLKSEGYVFKYFIIGDGSERPSLEKQVKEKKLEDFIVFVGYENNPYKYIAKCDLLISSSLYEAFSTVATEAIILGTPVLTTDCSGMKELFNNTNAGLIVDNNDTGIYFGMKKILNDCNLLKDMKKDAKIRSRYFQIDKLMSEIEDIIV